MRVVSAGTTGREETRLGDVVSGASSESVVAFKEVTKRFDDFVAVDRVSVDIRRGESRR